MRKNKSKKYPRNLKIVDSDSIKFYSSYDGVWQWEILTKEQRDLIMKDEDVRESGKLDYYLFMFPHRTFSEAKCRILMNLQGDRDEAKMAINDCKRLKKSALKKP